MVLEPEATVMKMHLWTGFLFAAQVVSGAVIDHPGPIDDVKNLRDSYDFIIIGGGTAGLTVADRLSEAFPKSKLTGP
jgi:ribulose 1,5-bisphosphate synthetase/thiazole synthase